jgi:hypothetical protein
MRTVLPSCTSYQNAISAPRCLGPCRFVHLPSDCGRGLNIEGTFLLMHVILGETLTLGRNTTEAKRWRLCMSVDGHAASTGLEVRGSAARTITPRSKESLHVASSSFAYKTMG